MASTGKKSKKVKSLPARSLTPKQATNVKGGIIAVLPAVQKPADIASCDGSVRPNANINFQKV